MQAIEMNNLVIFVRNSGTKYTKVLWKTHTIEYQSKVANMNFMIDIT